MPIASIIDWYGPYGSHRRLCEEAALMDGARCVYMGVKRNHEDGVTSIQYVGLSTRPATRFQNHHALLSAEIDSYYLGEITTAGIPGRRPKKVPSDLDATEHALIYYLQPHLNVRRKTSPPEDCVAVFSRFFGKNNPEKPKPTPDFFPPTISYNSWAEEWHPPPQRHIPIR